MSGLGRWLRAGSAAGAMATALVATAAQAQVATNAVDASAQQAASPDMGSSDIVVTGTRIRRPGLESNSPITVVSDQEVKLEGATNVDSVLNRLPQITADANDNVSNGSDGTSQVNLRGLGSNRVLVLINGQRMLPGQATDLNFVPPALIDRIDVVTGGASAVYGSDALSGVINFVLKDNLEGLRLDAQAGFAQNDNGNSYVRNIVSARGYNLAAPLAFDGGTQTLNAAYGKNFADGRGNITIYGGYRHVDPVLQSDRDVSSCALQQANAAGTALSCGGSSNTPYGTFVPLGGPNQGNTLTNSKDGTKTWVPYDSSYAYNYSPTNYIQRSDQRYTAGAYAKYEFSSAAELYGSFMFMHDHSFSQVAPSALFLGTDFTVPCNNPLLSASQATALCGAAAGTAATQDTLIGYRLTIAPRRDNLRHEDFRYSVGLRGDLGSGFSYDVGYQRSKVIYDETYLNNVDTVKAQRALNVVNVNGVPTCRSVIDGTDPNCIPANVFQANGVTAAQGTYLFSPSNTASRNQLDVISGTINGDLGMLGIKSPWADRGVAIAIGAEHRYESLYYFADAVAQQGGTVPTDGTIAVNEGYGEIEIPLLQNLPLAKTLTLNGGVRYSAYDNNQASTGLHSSYTAWTYKGEVNWEPVTAVRVRASYNHAFRAPNVGELFGAQTVGNVSADDPCAGRTPTASPAICSLTGVSSAQYGNIVQCPADTCSALGGGNRNVKPEVGNTYTAGLVLTPEQIRNFSLSVDYYHIKVTNYIGSVDPSLAISQCAATGSAFYCGLFVRDPRSGAIFGSNGYLISTTINTGYLLTSGIDIGADYTIGIGRAGKVNLNLIGTYLLNQIAEPLPGLGTYDCKGLYGYTCGEPSPTWRHVLRTTWQIPGGSTLSLAWRHLSAVGLSSLSSNAFLAGTPSVVNAKIPTYDYFDLAGTVAVGKQFTLRAGVNNLLDKDPPAIASGILASFGNGNTYPGVYDPLGRTIFVGVTVNF